MVFVAKSQLVSAVREELAQNPNHYAISVITDGEEVFWRHFEDLVELFGPVTIHFEPYVAGVVILTCMFKRCRALRRRGDMTNLEITIEHAGPYVFRLLFGCRTGTSVSIDDEDNVCVDTTGAPADEKELSEC